MHEIYLPDAKPALEWVNNRVLQKVTPRRKHALAQLEFAAALATWARSNGSGMAGTEWQIQLQPPGEICRTLVPDAAFLSYDRMPIEEQEATEVMRVAPNVVVEVRSPGDLQRDIDEKIRVYLAAGTDVIFLVDPLDKVVIVRDGNGHRVVRNGELIEHPTLHGFSMSASLLFNQPRPLPRPEPD